MSVVYEVNLSIDNSIETEFRGWLEAHIGEMLEIEGFLSARLYEVAEPEADAGRFELSVQYKLRDMAVLESYLTYHAERMRAEGLKRFGERFSATRRIMKSIIC